MSSDNDQMDSSLLMMDTITKPEHSVTKP